MATALCPLDTQVASERNVCLALSNLDAALGTRGGASLPARRPGCTRRRVDWIGPGKVASRPCTGSRHVRLTAQAVHVGRRLTLPVEAPDEVSGTCQVPQMPEQALQGNIRQLDSQACLSMLARVRFSSNGLSPIQTARHFWLARPRSIELAAAIKFLPSLSVH